VAGTLDVLECDLRRAQAVDRWIVARGDALRFLVDEEHADAFVVALSAGSARRDDQRVGPGTTEHHRLLAAQHESRALLLRCRREISIVEATLRLGERECDHRFAGRDAGQPFRFLRFAAAMAEKSAADHDGCA
jgi:hypothetical protein